MCSGPHGDEQFVTRPQPSGVFHQIAQNREHLGRQQDAIIAATISVTPQTLIDEIIGRGGNSFIVPSDNVLHFRAFFHLARPRGNSFPAKTRLQDNDFKPGLP
jgi:hypothetical protein